MSAFNVQSMWESSYFFTWGCVNDHDNDGNDDGSDGVRDGDHVSDIDKMMICRRHIHPSHSRLP